VGGAKFFNKLRMKMFLEKILVLEFYCLLF
jgi:hypothetical protein